MCVAGKQPVQHWACLVLFHFKAFYGEHSKHDHSRHIEKRFHFSRETSKFRKKLRTDWGQGMLAIIRYRILCLPVCYPKVWKFRYTDLYFCLLFCMGVETWSLTLREECRLRLFENSVLRIILGPKRMRWQVSGENYIMRGLIICTAHPILSKW